MYIVERNKYIDIVKAITIVLVVLGHCIQYCSGKEFFSSGLFFHDNIYKFIYSFHMPLFMLISGYVFGYSMRKVGTLNDYYNMMTRKTKQLLLPLLSWSFIYTSIDVCKLCIKGDYQELTIIVLIKKIIVNFIFGPWFLWALWWCSIIVIITRCYMRDYLYVYLIGLLLTFIIPDKLNIIDISLYKFMYPFFVLGYWYNTHDYGKKIKISHSKYFICSVTIIFLIMLYFFSYDIYIYTSGYTILGKNILNQLWNNFYRMSIGLFGSISIMGILWILYTRCKVKYIEWLCYLGKCTLGIYIISSILIVEVLSNLTCELWGINYLLTAVETVIILIFALAINTIFQRNKLLNTLFLGGR